jgi:N-acetylmuramoyl-L-alanine amidase
VHLAVVLGLLISAAPALAQTGQPTTIYTIRNVFLRAGPGLGFRILAEMPGGEALTVLGQSSIWYNVKRADNTEGWVSGYYVSANPPGSGGGGGSGGQIYAGPTEIGDIAAVTASLLNVRTGPGVNLPVIARLTQGELVRVLEKSGAWRRIAFRNNAQGWVNGQWLSGPIFFPPPQTGGGGAPSGGVPPLTTVVTPANATPLEVNIVTTSRLNVRTGPSTLYAVVTVLNQNEFVTVLAKQGGWRYIQTSGGKRGWSNIEGLSRCDCALP